MNPQAYNLNSIVLGVTSITSCQIHSNALIAFDQFISSILISALETGTVVKRVTRAVIMGSFLLHRWVNQRQLYLTLLSCLYSFY